MVVPAPPRRLILVVTATAVVVMAVAVPQWSLKWSWLYAGTWAATLLIARLRVSMNWAAGGLWASTVTAGLFFSLVQFGTAATLPLALATGCYSSRLTKRGRDNTTLRSAFNAANFVVSTCAAGLAMHAVGPAAGDTTKAAAFVASAMIYFCVNSLLVATVIGLTQKVRIVHYWTSACLVAAPYYLVCAAAGGIAAAVVHEPTEVVVASVVVLPVYLTYRGYVLYVAHLKKQFRIASEASALNVRISEALILAITAPDGATPDRVRRLQQCGRELAVVLGLDEAQQQAVALAVLLRDIGMLAIPRDLVRQSARLSGHELARLQQHPQLSVDILGDVGLPEPVLPTIAAHHEHWDGSGYPRGLSGNEIPRAARIVAVLDYFDAEIHASTASRPHAVADALVRIAERAGRAFDPEVAGAFVELMRGDSRLADAPQATPTAVAAAASLNHAHVLDAISAAQRKDGVVHEIADGLQSSLPFAEAMESAARRLGSVLPIERLELRYAMNRADETMLVTVGEARGDARRADGETGGGAMIEVPLQASAEGAGTLGTLTVHARAGHDFERDDERIVRQVGIHVGRRLGAESTLEEARHAAATDPLTGLANRRSLLLGGAAKIDRAARIDAPLAVLMIDLDGFKALNDTFGHSVGDAALIAAARRLEDSVRPSDLVARFAGDEFVVLLEACGPVDVEARREHLQARLCDVSLATPAGVHRLSASVGSALFPADGDTMEQLLAAADALMYADKQRRRRAA